MNNKWVKIILFLFLALGILFFVSSYFGLAHHFLIKQQIFRMAGVERELAEGEFYAKNKADNVFTGTIAKINRRGGGGVWVWSNQGLKYFQANEHTFYSYYDVCDVRAKTLETNFKIDFKIDDESRKITTDIKQWASWTKAGDFVQLMIVRSENSGQVGNLREIYAYSHPLFLPLELGLLCPS